MVMSVMMLAFYSVPVRREAPCLGDAIYECVDFSRVCFALRFLIRQFNWCKRVTEMSWPRFWGSFLLHWEVT